MIKFNGDFKCNLAEFHVFVHSHGISGENSKNINGGSMKWYGIH